MNKAQQEHKIGKVMGEFKRGELHSSSGEVVDDRDQAIAIAMSVAGKARKRKKHVKESVDDSDDNNVVQFGDIKKQREDKAKEQQEIATSYKPPVTTSRLEQLNKKLHQQGFRVRDLKYYNLLRDMLMNRVNKDGFLADSHREVIKNRIANVEHNGGVLPTVFGPSLAWLHGYAEVALGAKEAYKGDSEYPGSDLHTLVRNHIANPEHPHLETLQRERQYGVSHAGVVTKRPIFTDDE